ncbi:gluconate 2-dehydrogenase subunit 3 family protein [Burkholderia pseudomallei]|nr:gluconate 2-dehydrogenase subunit 3 family protein [Burkholderia pseudomallei]
MKTRTNRPGGGVPARGRYAGYDVLAKRDTPSWNDATRRVLDARLAPREAPRYLDARQFATLDAVCARIVAQSEPRDARQADAEADAAAEAEVETATEAAAAAETAANEGASTRTPIPVAALIDERLLHDEGDGYRDARMPSYREAWRIGLAALDAHARAEHGRPFASLAGAERDAILRAAQRGALDGPAWRGMSSALFFSKRVLSDVASAYYSHPLAWNEIGFGGPASPRGYVRMDFNRRDPWEAPLAARDDGRADADADADADAASPRRLAQPGKRKGNRDAD